MNPILTFLICRSGAAPWDSRTPHGPAAHRFASALVRIILFLILADVASGAAPASGMSGAPPASGNPVSAAAASTAALSRLIRLIGPDYKKGTELPDTFFNPFKVEATLEMALQKRGAVVTEQGIADAVGRKGVSGIIYAASASLSQVIIGDQVFRVGDELDFPDGEGGTMAPLVAGASVILRGVDPKDLVFDFTAEGESARRSTFSLRNFWAP
jgi:hypothetical protein